MGSFSKITFFYVDLSAGLSVVTGLYGMTDINWLLIDIRLVLCSLILSLTHPESPEQKVTGSINRCKRVNKSLVLMMVGRKERPSEVC